MPSSHAPVGGVYMWRSHSHTLESLEQRGQSSSLCLPNTSFRKERKYCASTDRSYTRQRYGHYLYRLEECALKGIFVAPCRSTALFPDILSQIPSKWLAFRRKMGCVFVNLPLVCLRREIDLAASFAVMQTGLDPALCPILLRSYHPLQYK